MLGECGGQRFITAQRPVIAGNPQPTWLVFIILPCSPSLHHAGVPSRQRPPRRRLGPQASTPALQWRWPAGWGVPATPTALSSSCRCCGRGGRHICVRNPRAAPAGGAACSACCAVRHWQDGSGGGRRGCGLGFPARGRGSSRGGRDSRSRDGSRQQWWGACTGGQQATGPHARRRRRGGRGCRNGRSSRSRRLRWWQRRCRRTR